MPTKAAPWRVVPGLHKSGLYTRLLGASDDDSRIRPLVVLVDRVWKECADVSSTILQRMPEFTLHDETHASAVLDLMERLMPAAVVNRLRPMELAGLILSAALHDTGMAPDAKELASLRATDPPADGEVEWAAYRSFREGYPRLSARQGQLAAEGRTAEAGEVEGYILCQYVRKTHAERTRTMIYGRYGDQLAYGNYGFAGDLADVCASHDNDIGAVVGLKCRSLVAAPGEYCNWRFVAVLLRLADILDFDAKRTPQVLFEHLGIRDPVSVREWRKHMSICGWDVQPGRIAYSAQCPDPVVEKTVRTFIDAVDAELASATMALNDMHDPAEPGLREHYELGLAARVDRSDIRPKSGPDGPLYDYVDVSFHLDQDNIVDLVMGFALYAERVLFLRELLQNAADACRCRAAIHAGRPELGPYAPKVVVRLVAASGAEYIEVEDNGIGMASRIIREYFARLGRSYYKSEEFHRQRAAMAPGFRPIGQFGIGVYSAFMAGDQVEIETRRIGDGASPLHVQIDGEGGLFWFRRGARPVPGTQVRVRLSSPSASILRESWHPGQAPPAVGPSLRAAVSRLAPHLDIPLCISDGADEADIVAGWELPDVRLPDERYMTMYDIDLTEDAPEGLDGMARVFILGNGGAVHPSMTIDAGAAWPAAWSDPAPPDAEDLHDRLEQEPGYIDHIHVDYSIREGHTEGWYTEVESEGRWSQHGFLVPCPLFAQAHDRRGASPPVVPFPFAVWYDLGLSGDFSLPLSLDRKAALPTPEAWSVCDRIGLELGRLLLRAMGTDMVSRNRVVLSTLATTQRGDKEPFGAALRECLRDGSPRGSFAE